MKLSNPPGLTFEFLENGAIKSIHSGPVRISLKAASLYSGPGTGIYLRKRSGGIEFAPLFGPGSSSRFGFTESGYIAEGIWKGVEYTCKLRLAEGNQSWQWSILLKNSSSDHIEMGLIYMQEIGLKANSSGPVNEYYVSQYLERRILQDDRYGAVVCCRQNMRESTGHPWLMVACKNGAASACTDGMQWYGKSFRQTGIPEGLSVDHLGGECAGESPVVALQSKPILLGPGEVHQEDFLAVYVPDHPGATSEVDLKLIHFEDFMAFQLKKKLHEMSSHAHKSNLFSNLQFLPVEDLSSEELSFFFGDTQRFPEYADGRMLSFFSQYGHHVVLREKEIMTDRPHGHIMQAKPELVPAESIMSTTSFMSGVFNSHLTQGNTNFNVFLSVCTSQFNQSPETGQRIILTINNRPFLLGVPSAFEMGLNHCRWIYKSGDLVFQVRTWTSQVTAQVNLDLQILRGHNVNLAITHDFDPMNHWEILPGNSIHEYWAKPATDSMIATKFPKAQFRILVQGEREDFAVDAGGTESLCVIHVTKSSSFCMSFIGEVTGPADVVMINDSDKQWLSDTRAARTEWKDLSLNLELISDQDDVLAIREILPWYGMNALTHYLTPYGLEQFGGAAWGTRDVSQGPVELLLTLEKYDEARQVLCTIFSNQNPDGGWPQWWMFDSYREIRAHEAHGDIFYWCIIALARYIRVTGDMSVLSEVLPYYHDKGPEFAEKSAVGEHIDRLIKMITESFIPGTALVPFSGGDWNDSLQPVSKELAQKLISSWTVEMNYQAFNAYIDVYKVSGETEKARKLEIICEKIKADFNKYLVHDGIVAGYGKVESDGSISVMLHPADQKTGVHYSILPMERGILSGIFTNDQAEHHLAMMEKHLKGPDGARLMDRPLKYKGGIQEIFQRAESSTFFGREIGLMYVHEHIRYAEALAVTGKAEAFVKALRQAIPVGYRDVVPSGDFRQSNCYYSSSDVIFRNRFEADAKYEEVIQGKWPLKGGWRVYSSGPGIFIGIVVTRLLGLRVEAGRIIIDPVMPASFDGLSAGLDFLDYLVRFIYRVEEGQFSPKAITINGQAVLFSLEENKYRSGGAVIPADQFVSLLEEEGNVVEVIL